MRGYLTFPSPPVLWPAASQLPGSWTLSPQALCLYSYSKTAHPLQCHHQRLWSGSSCLSFILSCYFATWMATPIPQLWASCFLCYCVNGCVPSHEWIKEFWLPSWHFFVEAGQTALRNYHRTVSTALEWTWDGREGDFSTSVSSDTQDELMCLNPATGSSVRLSWRPKKETLSQPRCWWFILLSTAQQSNIFHGLWLSKRSVNLVSSTHLSSHLQNADKCHVPLQEQLKMQNVARKLCLVPESFSPMSSSTHGQLHLSCFRLCLISSAALRGHQVSPADLASPSLQGWSWGWNSLRLYSEILLADLVLPSALAVYNTLWILAGSSWGL